MATYIQGKANGVASASTVAVTLDANVTAGHRLVVVVRIPLDITAAGRVTDSAGHVYTDDAEYMVSGLDHITYSTVVTSSGPLTVTFAPGSSGRLGIAVYEFSGLGAYGGQTTGQSGTSATPSTGAITPAAPTGITVAAVVINAVVTWEADYAVNALTAAGATGRLWVGYKLISSTASETASATSASGAWTAFIAWYPDTAATGATLGLDAAAVALAGQALALRAGRATGLDPASVALAASDVALVRGRTLGLDPATVALAASDLALVYAPAQHVTLTLAPAAIVVAVGAIPLDYSGRVVSLVRLVGSFAPILYLRGSHERTLAITASDAHTMDVVGAIHGSRGAPWR